jgi:hypothetical protein
MAKKRTLPKAPAAPSAPESPQAPAKPAKKPAAKPARKRKTASRSVPENGPSSGASTVSTLSTSSNDSLDILMITPEARPFAKTGGLADVCGALPLALARLGHRVTIVLPKYRGAQTAGADGRPADVPFGLHSYPVRFIEQPLAEGVTAVLVDAPAL